VEDVEDEPLFAERVAGIDIGKTEVMVTVRVPSDTRPGRRQQETRAFRAVRKDLLALADWLRAWGVTKAGMEATGDYWKPVYFLLEREGFDCVLYHAARVKALPGRPKTDKLDSAWLAKITERGSLPSSFVPPEEIRRLRTHTRYRRHLTQARTAEKARCEKLLEDAHLKLSSVITDIHGVSGRDMLNAIIAGERNPKVLAQMAQTRMRGKIRQLEEALDCSFFTEQHAFILQMMLANIDHHTAQIKELSAKIEVLCEPYAHQIAQLDTIPGFGVITAQDIIAETGVDMTVFPTAGHLASWARQAPKVSESAGKRKGKNATGRGNPYTGGALGEAAVNAGRTQTFLGAKYRRLVRHMPKKKAQGAISRSQLVICHALLSDPDAVYTDLGTGYYEQRAGIRRQVRNHIRAIERHGYIVTIEATSPDPDTEALPVTKAS
jgi:transposase